MHRASERTTYFLTTERLGFRAWRDDEADFARARSLWGDPAVTRYLMGAPLGEAEVRDRLTREAANLRAIGLQYWPLFLLDSADFVGCCGLKPCPYEGTPEAPELELGFHLVPAMWGRGLASEAAAAAARLALERPGVRRLYAGHHPDNRASGAVLGKLGFRYHRHVFYEATGLDHPLYVLEPSR